MTRLVRVANAGLKVAGFSTSCGESVRVAGKGLWERRLKVESSKFNGEKTKRWLAWRGYPHPPVFSVRVANKGLRLDAASKASTFGKLNTGTPRPGRGKLRAQRSEMGTDLEVRAGGRVRLAAIMGNDSTKVTDCQ